MVTFALPGDNDGPDASRGTPRPRAPLPFAKRSFAASPYGSKRLGTPQSSSARKLLTTRDEVPSSSLNKSSIATARNIFRASSISDSPPVIPFSPSLNMPQNTPKKVFAPGATPEPSRVYRESTAHATPRGMAARATSKDLFPMRIEDPDPELSGEVLTRKIPKDWNSKGSIYADQFLAHLCPPEFDDEQRRQFFCILDLRRLKYAANEIFSKKDWKLNVINFAKEFEKSRSIILLRYGLYEFQNVKPSKEILKRWRREHGIAEPEDEEVEPTPSKAIPTKKRKADEESSKETAPASDSANQNKRRATVRDEEEDETSAPTPALNKNKRKASLSGESETQPSKMQKSAPSAAKSLFEKIANKSTTTPVGSPAKPVTNPVEDSSTPKPNPFAAKTNGSLARSVFQNLKPGSAQPNSNIFGYLSDASSAKNSGVEADAESSTGSELEESQEAGQSDEQDAAASNAETASQIGTSLFGQKAPPTSSSLTAGVSSTPGTRESTPGRSLFDRVTKNSDGQPVRAEEPTETPSSENPAAPADQTWNPSTTPLKFAPSTSTTQSGSLFGTSTPSAPTGSIFMPKTTTASSNIFGAAKQDKPAEKKPTPVTGETDKGGESDKENDSQAPKKSLFEPKVPAAQPNFGTSLFQAKTAETPKETEPSKPASALLGGFTPKPTTDKSGASASSASTVFGAVKSIEPTTTPTTSVMSSSTLFGAKPAGSEQPAASETPKFSSLLAAPATTSTSSDAAPSGSLFGAKAPSTASNLFGGAPSTISSKPLFGMPSASNTSTAPKADTTADKATPALNLGATSSGSDKPNGTAAKFMFGAPKSPASGATANSLFGGSPMKQDNPSPAKKAFDGSTNGAASSAPIFDFGNAQSNNSAPPLFGGTFATPTNGAGTATPNFGAASSTNTGSGGFGFNFGGASSGTSFHNPFTSGNSGASSGSAPNSTSGGMFSFGSNAAPSSGSSPFQFGNASGNTLAPTFGAGSVNNNSKPMFGSGAPTVNFQAASPQPPQGGGFVFGSNQPAPAVGNLQPPAGGASTTGTNTPFSLGGGSSLATTPAGGTPEPSARSEGATGDDNEGGEKHEQINLTEGLEADEENLHEVRAKVLKFKPAEDKSDGDDKPKSKSPWTTQGIGPLRLLKHKETNAVRLLLRAEPRGHVAMNRAVLPDMSYKADEKYVKLTTSNESGDGLETWMIQVKTKDLAKELAEKLEEHKKLNKT